MPNTPNLELPYPDESFPADVPVDTEKLALAMDALYAQLLFVPGDIKISAAQNPTTGWLKCDGAAVPRGAYADLFAAIGTVYGAGDGSTTFNVPDYRGRTILGAGAGAGLTNRALGSKGGEETHVLTTAELASHNHTAPKAVLTNDNNQSVAYTVTGTPDSPGSGRYHLAGWSTGFPELSVFPTINNTGSGAAHNTMPPYATANVFIKT